MANESKSLGEILASLSNPFGKGKECRLILPREYHDEIKELRRVNNLSGIKCACLMAASKEAMMTGDYDHSVRLYDELEEAKEANDWTGHNLVTRLGQILPKIPVSALRRPCCPEHGLGIEIDYVEDMIYVHWKSDRCSNDDVDVVPSRIKLLGEDPDVK